MLSPPFIFLLLCLPARYLLARYTSTVPDAHTTILGAALAAVGIAFLYLFLSDSRLNAPEAGGSGTWWNRLRPIHGLLYLLGGILLIAGYPKQYAATCLWIDLLVGAVAHVSRYWL
jgi:hypothetical protein